MMGVLDKLLGRMGADEAVTAVTERLWQVSTASADFVSDEIEKRLGSPLPSRIRTQLFLDFLFLHSHLFERVVAGAMSSDKHAFIVSAVQVRLKVALASMLFPSVIDDQQRSAVLDELGGMLYSFDDAFAGYTMVACCVPRFDEALWEA
jgi:hypothetical protein